MKLTFFTNRRRFVFSRRDTRRETNKSVPAADSQSAIYSSRGGMVHLQAGTISAMRAASPVVGRVNFPTLEMRIPVGKVGVLGSEVLEGSQ